MPQIMKVASLGINGWIAETRFHQEETKGIAGKAEIIVGGLMLRPALRSGQVQDSSGFQNAVDLAQNTGRRDDVLEHLYIQHDVYGFRSQWDGRKVAQQPYLGIVPCRIPNPQIQRYVQMAPKARRKPTLS